MVYTNLLFHDEGIYQTHLVAWTETGRKRQSEAVILKCPMDSISGKRLDSDHHERRSLIMQPLLKYKTVVFIYDSHMHLFS